MYTYKQDCMHEGMELTREKCHECHFGPYFAYEGQGDDVIQIKGLKLTDDDIQVHVCVCVCVCVWVGGWLAGWLGGWLCVCVHARVYVCVYIY